MRRTKEEAEATRQALLATALRVFGRQGYAGSRLEDVAQEAGVTRGAIYHHFAGKADLWLALVADAAQRMQPVMESALAEGSSPLESLRRYGVGVLSLAAEDPRFREVSELLLFRSELSDELAAGTSQKRAGTRMVVGKLAELVRLGIDGGEIRPDVAPEDAALGLLALQNGLLSLWLADRRLFSLRNRAEQIVDVYLAGLVPEGGSSTRKEEL
jgi:TetR/AcrR family acrAB operon transcriptional repressor